MPRTLPALLLLLALCTLVLADEPLTFPSITTTRGVTYRDVKVSRFDALEVHFTHASGVAAVPLADLPEDLQFIFAYDPRKAATVMDERKHERVKTIITEADKKAKTAAQTDQDKADAAELKTIRASALRCYVSRVDVSDEALVVEVAAADKLPVMVTSKNGKYERVKRNAWGETELVEQIVPDKPFALGSPLRLMPKTAPVISHTFITVYLIDTGIGAQPLCALTPEDAQKYRKKLTSLKAATKPPHQAR